jgi:hypothetical protein
MAEREGFEPSRRGLATYAISSRVPSASSDTSPLPYRFESPALRSTKILAEREGFEPSVRFYPYNRLAGGCLQPARPPLRFDAVYRNLHTLVVHSIITTVYLHRAPSARRSRGASASATLAILRSPKQAPHLRGYSCLAPHAASRNSPLAHLGPGSRATDPNPFPSAARKGRSCSSEHL